MENALGQCRIGTTALDGVVQVGNAGAVAVPRLQKRQAILFWLLVLNIALQIFDGAATYAGLHLGIREANPLLRSAFHFWGIVPTLLVFKGQACGLLLLLYRIAGEQLAMPALGALAGVYSICSLMPWLGVFVRLLMRTI